MPKVNLSADPIHAKEFIKSLNVQFAEYVKGLRRKFDLGKIGIRSDLRELSGTPLQKSVWRELLTIPYGEVISYEELAKRVGNPNAVRAVASAVGDNPLCIVIPCHRILPKSSIEKLEKMAKLRKNAEMVKPELLKRALSAPVKVGGYAYGSDIKEALLRIEGVL